MKRFSLFIGCIISISLILAQQTESSTDFYQVEEDILLPRPEQLKNLYPYINKEIFYGWIMETIEDGHGSLTGSQWVNSLIESLSEKPEREEGSLRRRHLKKAHSYEADTRNHLDSKLRDQFVRGGKIPGFPGTPTMTHKKSGAYLPIMHKLDSTVNRNFDPFLDAWVDYRVHGYVFNDSGRVVAGYTLDNFDNEGTIDTVFKYYYLFGEDGFPTERITYQWDADLLQAVLYEKRLYEFYEPDSIVNIYYLYDLETESWILSTRRVSHYEGELIKRTETYTWIEDTGEWRMTAKSESDHTVDGKLLWNNHWSWNEAEGGLIFDTRQERNYDQFGNEILYASSRWSIEDNDWRTWLKFTSRYSDHNKQLESSFFFWLADSLGLIKVNQTDYEYVADTLLNSMTNYESMSFS